MRISKIDYVMNPKKKTTPPIIFTGHYPQYDNKAPTPISDTSLFKKVSMAYDLFKRSN